MLKKVVKLGELTLQKKLKEEERKKHRLIDLFWECTLTCNAHCKHCGSRAEKRKYEGELTTKEIKNALKQIADSMDAPSIFINVTGGEPLVRKDLCEVMEYATKQLGFSWGMTTNGILLNDENIEKLREARLSAVSISLDGLEHTHDEFRGAPGSYKMIIENIKKLKKANVEGIQVTTVVNKTNINELEELYKVLMELNLDSWRLASMDPIGRAKENDELLLNGKELKYLLDFILKKNKEKKLKILYGCPGFLGLKYEKSARENYFYCRTGISVASILYNGDLFVCPNVPRIKSLIQGNIKQDNFKEVWENQYKEFRKEDRTKCKNCENCKYWQFCLGGAYHTWNFEKGIQNKCPYEMMYKNKSL